jgi:nicotinate-nucleotide adenylyltransferase
MGGTFDPIHRGHLVAAEMARDQCGLDRVLFVPSLRPPHRPESPSVSGYHRFLMTALAVADVPGWQASDMELARAGASYTFDTLDALRRAEPESQFFFIIGADAFAEIATWWRYPAVLDLAHFVVVARDGTSLARLPQRLPDLASRMVNGDRTNADRTGAPPRIHLVNRPTPPVSSSDIRRRVKAGESIDGLVPAPVARHIVSYRLYA